MSLHRPYRIHVKMTYTGWTDLTTHGFLTLELALRKYKQLKRLLPLNPGNIGGRTIVDCAIFNIDTGKYVVLLPIEAEKQ